jgi:hypothetical protein
MKTLVVGVILTTFGALSSLAQTITFRAGELVVSPGDVTTTKCVQVGLYMTFTDGPSSNWSQVTSTLDYTAPAGFLSGNPFVNVSDFANPPKAGLTNPGTPMTNSSAVSTPCAAVDIINAPTLGTGPTISLMTGNGPASLVNEAVNTVTGRVDITSIIFVGDLFTTDPGVEYLFAILEFPLAANQGTGEITIDFTPNGVVADGNIVVTPGTTLNAVTDDGFIQVFDTIDCGDATNFVTFADAVGAGSASTQNNPNANLNIDYLDPAFGGPGGEIDATVNYGAGVEAYQITGDDGFDTGIVPVVSPGSSMETINPVNASTVYTITYFVLALDGVTLVPGAACTVTVGWNPVSCTLSWLNNGIGGAASVLTLTLTNAVATAGSFADIDVPNGATGLADPIQIVDNSLLTGTAGGTATFEVLNQSVPDATWCGTYTVTGLANGAGPSVATCSDVFGCACPTMVANSSLAGMGTIGGPLTVNLSAMDQLSWEVEYDGLITPLPGTDTMYVIPAINANATDVIVRALGVGPDGLPCQDEVTLPIDYVAPTCDSTTQSPDSTVTPVDVGTVITLTLVTSGAVSATIDAVPMAVVGGTVGVSNMITWQATHVAVADTTVTAVITNPDGEMQNCTWIIDINCIDPMFISVAPVGQTGIVISGTPDCEYTVRVTEHNTGQVTTFNIIVGPNGTGSNTTFVIPPDAWIEVGQDGIATVTDMVLTVPTLGEWALIGFVLLLMAAAVVFMRRGRRTA